MTKSQHSEQMLRAHLIPSDFGIPNQWAVQSKYYADARIEQDRASLAAQVEALTADLHAAEVRVGSLLCERSDLIQQLMDERDSLRADSYRLRSRLIDASNYIYTLGGNGQPYRIDAAIEVAAGAQPATCKYCDGTGDVHSSDGEWRGRCNCEFGKATS